MEGNRQIRLCAPIEGAPQPDGSVETGYGLPLSIWAVRLDRGGAEKLQADTQAGKWTRRYEIRDLPILNGLNERWLLEDETGYPLDIESVQEAPHGHHRHLWIYAVRRGVSG